MKPLTTLDAEFLGGAGGVRHFLGGTAAHAFGIAIAPQTRGQNALVALVDDRVADTLPNKMVADGEALQTVLVEDVPAALDVVIVGERFIHLEVIAPAGEFQPVVAKTGGFRRQCFERQIRPLPGKKCNRSCHKTLLLFTAKAVYF